MSSGCDDASDSHTRAEVLFLMNLVALLCRMASKKWQPMFAMECQYSSFHQNANNVKMSTKRNGTVWRCSAFRQSEAK